MKKKVLIGLVIFLAGFVFLEAQYHFLLRANRFWDNNGILSSDNRIQTVGANNAFRAAYTDSLYVDVVCNDEGELEITKTITRAGENESTLVFDTTWQGQDESRQGIIYLYGERDTALTSWGGAQDFGLKMHVRNTADNTVAAGGLRGFESVASNRSTLHSVWAGYISAESRSGSETVNLYGLHILCDQSGNVNTENAILYLQQNSQSDVGTCYGIKLMGTAYAQTREFAMYVGAAGGSWVNGLSFNDTITNVFDFENTDGTNGAGYNASYSTPNAWTEPDGYIKVDIGGNTQYIYTWTTQPTT